MKIINFLIFIVICICIHINSCTKVNECTSPIEPYKILSDSIKSWLPYNTNTKLIFENISKQSDTIFLQNYFYGDDEVWRGFECSPGISQFKRCTFFDPFSKDSINAEIYLADNITIQKNLLTLEYNELTKDLGVSNRNGKFEQSIILNSKTFQNCIWIECGANDNCKVKNITKFYFSKGLGLIAFLRNNVLWTVK